MLSQLAKFPEFVEAAKAQESGKHAMAATAMSRVVDVCESALGAGSEMHLAAHRKMVNIHCLGDDMEAGIRVLREMERVTRPRSDPEWQGQATGAGALRREEDVLIDRLAVIWSGLVLFLRSGDAEYAGRWSDELLIVAHQVLRTAAVAAEKEANSKGIRPDSQEGAPVDVTVSNEDTAALWMGLAHAGGALAACLALRAKAAGQALGEEWSGSDTADAVEEHVALGSSAMLRLTSSPLEPAAGLVNALLDAARADALQTTGAGEDGGAAAELAYSSSSYFTPAHCEAGKTAAAGGVCLALNDAWLWVDPIAKAADAGIFSSQFAVDTSAGAASGSAADDDPEAGSALQQAAHERDAAEAPDGREGPASMLNPVSLDGARLVAVLGAELAAAQLRAGADPAEGLPLPPHRQEQPASDSHAPASSPAEEAPGVASLVSAVEAAGTALRCAEAASSSVGAGPGGMGVRRALGESSADALLGSVLRVVAETQHRQSKAVTAEGLLRSAAAHATSAYERVGKSDCAVADAACQIHFSLARLTSDWEKRESDSLRFATAGGEMRPAVAPPAIVLALDWGFCGDGW